MSLCVSVVIFILKWKFKKMCGFFSFLCFNASHHSSVTSEAWLALLLALLALGSTLFALDAELVTGLAHWVVLAILLDALLALVVGANAAGVGLN
jgi:hypothetical protein